MKQAIWLVFGLVVSLILLMVGTALYVEGTTTPSPKVTVTTVPSHGLTPLDMPLCAMPAEPRPKGPCQWAAGGEIIVTELKDGRVVHTYPDGTTHTEYPTPTPTA